VFFRAEFPANAARAAMRNCTNLGDKRHRAFSNHITAKERSEKKGALCSSQHALKKKEKR